MKFEGINRSGEAKTETKKTGKHYSNVASAIHFKAGSDVTITLYCEDKDGKITSEEQLVELPN